MAVTCMSVCLSVRPSVRLRQILWLRNIRWQITPELTFVPDKTHPEIWKASSLAKAFSERMSRKVAIFSLQVAISPKRCKLGPRLLLITDMKYHTRIRLVPKSVTLGNLERPLRTLALYTCIDVKNVEIKIKNVKKRKKRDKNKKRL